MSEKTAATTEKPLRRLRGKAVKTGALAMSIGAMSGMLAPVAHAEHYKPRKPKVEHIQRGLKNPAELPGSRIRLSPEIQDQLKSATVELGMRLRPDLPGGSPDQPFTPWCTAVKVQVQGDPSDEFASAAHCFSGLTGAESGALHDLQNPDVKAENFTALSEYQFAVLDPSEPDLNVRSVQPVAIIDQISISTDDKDTALMRVGGVNTIQVSSPNIRTLDEIPSLPFKALKNKPLPGTPVGLYGEPQASGFEPIAGKGTYVGRVVYKYTDQTSGEAITRYLDVVGFKTSTLEEDNCNFGASGSVAELPDGQILGNLSTRLNLGYGPLHSMEAGDISLDDNMRWATDWGYQLGVELRNFTTICGFTVIGKDTPTQMVVGYGVPANGKGADPTGGSG